MNRLDGIHGMKDTFTWSTEYKTSVFNPSPLLCPDMQNMISKIDSMDMPSMHDQGKPMQMNEESKTIHQALLISKGIASFKYNPTIVGNYKLMIEIDKISNTDSSLSIDLIFMAHEKESHGMMGMGASWDYPVIGILAMSAMMVTMWAIRGGF